MPPTFAAALIIKFGLTSDIVLVVSDNEKRFVSSRVEGITSFTCFDFVNTLTRLDPTNPFEPKIKTFILYLFYIILC